MWWWVGSALAGEAVVAPDVMAGLGPGAGFGATDSVGGSAGVAGVWFPTDRVGVQAEVREGLWSSEVRTLGQIGFAARFRVTNGLDLWAGFVHHHETPIAVVEDQPIGAMAGVAEGIHHRSGGEIGASYGWPLRETESLNVVLRLETAISAFPDPSGPPVYGQALGTLWFEIPELRRHSEEP